MILAAGLDANLAGDWFREPGRAARFADRVREILALGAGHALAAVPEGCAATFLQTGLTDLCAARSAVAFWALADALVAVEVLPAQLCGAGEALKAVPERLLFILTFARTAIVIFLKWSRLRTRVAALTSGPKG